jgi:hypothetical protein
VKLFTPISAAAVPAPIKANPKKKPRKGKKKTAA